MFPFPEVNLGTVMTSRVTIPQLTTAYDPIIATLLHRVTVDGYSHALVDHPNSAHLVHECMENQGPYIQFQIYKNERYLRVCIVDEDAGLMGFQIVDIIGKEAKELTAYVKDNCRCIRDVLNYARRMRYPRFTGPL